MDRSIEVRKCLYSGEEFIPKRNNQIFASRKNRNNYHNKINNQLRNELKSVNNQLTLNYKICSNLLGKNKSITIHREFLKGKGFDFTYFIGFSVNKANNGYTYALYDTSFERIDENHYLITKL